MTVTVHHLLLLCNPCVPLQGSLYVELVLPARRRRRLGLNVSLRSVARSRGADAWRIGSSGRSTLKTTRQVMLVKG